MGSMNLVVILGRLAADCQPKEVGPNRITMVRVPIITVRSFETAREVCRIDIEAWGAVAEAMVRTTSKGDEVLVRGRIRLNEWTDRKTKEQMHSHVVYVEHFSKPGSSSEPDDSSPA